MPAKEVQVNDAVSASSDLPDLIHRMETIDPALTQSLKGKSLLGSKSPWATLVCGLIGMAVAKWGLDLTPDDVLVLFGLGTVVGSYLVRLITRARITSILPKQ